MWGAIIKVVLYIPEIIKFITTVISFVEDWNRRAREQELEKLKQEIKDAKSEDDFRNAVDKL